MWRTLNKAVKRRPSSIFLFCVAWMLLGVFRLLVLTIPFRWLEKTLGEVAVETDVNTNDSDQRSASQVAWAVRRASDFTPWNSNCLAQGLAARYLLSRRRISSTLYFGAVSDHAAMRAHAWLRSGPSILTGRAGHEEYAVVATYAREFSATTHNLSRRPDSPAQDRLSQHFPERQDSDTQAAA